MKRVAWKPIVAAGLALVGAAAAEVVRVTYDSAGRVVAESYTNGAAVAYGYDAAGNLERIVSAGGAADPVDLAVTASFATAGATNGRTLEMRVALTNLAAQPAAGVVVTQVVMPAFAFVSASADQGSLTGATGLVVWNAGTVGPGAGIAAATRWMAAPEGAATQLVAVTCAADTNAANDRATNSLAVVGAADLALGLDDVPDPVCTGAVGRCRTTITNLGPSAVSTFTLVNGFPSQITNLVVGMSQGVCISTNYTVRQITFQPGAIASGATAWVELSYTVVQAGMLTNTSLATSANPSDPVSGNHFVLLRTRAVAPNLIVTSAADSGPGTLRQALIDASNTVAADAIAFSLPTGGPPKIAPSSPLPWLVGNTNLLDGSSQPGGFVELSGENIAGDPQADGLVVTGSYNFVRGLVVNRFPRHGILILGGGAADSDTVSQSNTVTGCRLGTDVAGTNDLGNGGAGVCIRRADRNTVGGTESGTGNLISGNEWAGVLVEDPGAMYNRVIGNLIGTDVSGARALGNTGPGILASNCFYNVFGGTNALLRNVISGNGGGGILVVAASAQSDLLGNYIGTDSAGRLALPNGGDGVRISGSVSSLTVSNNVIAGNGGWGLCLNATNRSTTAVGTVVANRIGLDAAGAAAVSNTAGGILVEGAATNVAVGGIYAGQGNVVSGNGGPGILISGPSVTGVVVRGNVIGLDTSRAAVRPNLGDGILVEDSPGVQVGDIASVGRNWISGNSGCGVRLTHAPACVVLGNYIGTDGAGLAARGNGQDGIRVEDSPGTSAGGLYLQFRNLIAGNGGNGVHLRGAGTSNTLVGANTIGLGADETTPLGNGGAGVRIFEASGNVVGGEPAFAGNRLSGNAGGILALSGSGNRFVRNLAYGNTGPEIDLGGDGATANDANDADNGANGLLNHPVLTGIASGGGSTTVTGTYAGASGRALRIEFFLSENADDGGRGEGATYLGAAGILTDGGGQASFAAMFATQIPANWYVAATATDTATGDTSEFSPALAFAATDTDGDSIPDAWELQFGLGLGAFSRTGDYDGDGHTDLQEYMGDTVPTNNQSYLRISTVRLAGGVEVGFTSSASRVYTLSATTNAAAPGAWQTVRSGIPGGGATAVTDTNPPAVRLYRVEASPP